MVALFALNAVQTTQVFRHLTAKSPDTGHAEWYLARVVSEVVRDRRVATQFPHRDEDGCSSLQVFLRSQPLVRYLRYISIQSLFSVSLPAHTTSCRTGPVYAINVRNTSSSDAHGHMMYVPLALLALRFDDSCRGLATLARHSLLIFIGRQVRSW